MTILNLYMKDKEKKRLQDFASKSQQKSVSDFVRKIIQEKLIVEDIKQEFNPEIIKIPDYIPANKYVIFGQNNAILAVADSLSESTLLAAKNGHQPPFIMKYNGPKIDQLEYVYLSLSEGKAWSYCPFNKKSYPLLQVKLFWSTITDNNEDRDNGKDSVEVLIGSIDTGASLCVLKQGIIPEKNLKILRKENISTANGTIEKPIYEGNLKIIDKIFKIEFLLAPISNQLPFQFLVGRNVLDRLDAYFFGKKQIFLLKIAEE